MLEGPLPPLSFLPAMWSTPWSLGVRWGADVRVGTTFAGPNARCLGLKKTVLGGCPSGRGEGTEGGKEGGFIAESWREEGREEGGGVAEEKRREREKKEEGVLQRDRTWRANQSVIICFDGSLSSSCSNHSSFFQTLRKVRFKEDAVKPAKKIMEAIRKDFHQDVAKVRNSNKAHVETMSSTDTACGVLP